MKPWLSVKELIIIFKPNELENINGSRRKCDFLHNEMSSNNILMATIMIYPRYSGDIPNFICSLTFNYDI